MNSKRFVSLDGGYPVVIEQPKVLANDVVEDISDEEEEEEWKQKPNHQQQNIIVVKKKPQVIVVKKQTVVVNTDPIRIPVELDNLIDDIVAFYEIEQRRKQRQRIKRKKANKRRYQKMLWEKRYRYKK